MKSWKMSQTGVSDCPFGVLAGVLAGDNQGELQCLRDSGGKQGPWAGFHPISAPQCFGRRHSTSISHILLVPCHIPSSSSRRELKSCASEPWPSGLWHRMGPPATAREDLWKVHFRFSIGWKVRALGCACPQSRMQLAGTLDCMVLVLRATECSCLLAGAAGA